jgi:hypothetical protein
MTSNSAGSATTARITRLKDTAVGDLEALNHSCLEDGEAFILEFVTSFVLESEYPDAHEQDVPW